MIIELTDEQAAKVQRMAEIDEAVSRHERIEATRRGENIRAQSAGLREEECKEIAAIMRRGFWFSADVEQPG